MKRDIVADEGDGRHTHAGFNDDIQAKIGS